jgi:hypothetical protein
VPALIARQPARHSVAIAASIAALSLRRSAVNTPRPTKPFEILVGDFDLKDAHPLALAPPVPQHPRHILPP